jgi:hypothetical protein
LLLAGTADSSGDAFSQVRPELDEYTKEPPPLPPHLRHIILNKVLQRTLTGQTFNGGRGWLKQLFARRELALRV